MMATVLAYPALPGHDAAMKSICVFCGSSPGADPAFARAAQELGELIARSGRTLVYGGGNVGLMGILADAALAAGGQVIGAIPRPLYRQEVAHMGLTHLHVVDTMHQRKALMADLSDGIIALPGGIGTLDEFFEIWTWNQLGLVNKPMGLLNVNGFYTELIAFVRSAVDKRFLRPEHLALVECSDSPKDLIQRMEQPRPEARTGKWLDRREGDAGEVR